MRIRLGAGMGENDGRGVVQSVELKVSLDTIAALVRTTAHQYKGQSLEILAVLRLLEAIHQEIRDGLFQDSLPDNRQALYSLLRDIELGGGWPYIHRMRLQAFLANLRLESSEVDQSGNP